MEDELRIIEREGMITSPELQEILDKNIRTIIRNLNKLMIREEISILIFQTDKHRKRVYMKNEIYDNLCKIN